jgi:DNA repair protein RecN (Recombination protein N)
VKNYKNQIEFNPEKIEELRNRSAELRKLMKKYGNIDEILKLKNDLENEQNIFNNFDEKIEELSNEIKEKQSEIYGFAIKLSEERKKIAKIFERKIVEELANLGIENSTFEVRFSLNFAKEESKNIDNIIKNFAQKSDNSVSKIDFPSLEIENKLIKLSEKGIDLLEFFLSTNKGGEISSLASVASGGEISRIMLAIKTILAESDKTPLLIFDEIDTGISGRIAQKVGFAMQNLAKFHQIISITHLPQIAAIGENILLISKNESENRVSTSAKILNETEKITEIAKMLSGEILTDSAIESAKSLIV